jgi:hypothetical protein
VAGTSQVRLPDRLAAGILDLAGVMWLGWRNLSLGGACELTGSRRAFTRGGPAGRTVARLDRAPAGRPQMTVAPAHWAALAAPAR